MNWEAIGAVAEAVGAVGVILTLAYLAVQIRQNTKSLRATTSQSVMGDASRFLENLYESPELNTLWLTGHRDPDALSEADRERFHFFIMSWLRRFENIHHQWQSGLLEDDQWESMHTSNLEGVLSPGGRAWWAQNSQRFNRGFRSYIDGELDGRSG